MSKWDLPLYVDISENCYEIRKKCEHRMVLDCLCAYNDMRLPLELRVSTAMKIFYVNEKNINDKIRAAEKMFDIINIKNENDIIPQNYTEKPLQIVDWRKDYYIMAQPISRVLGYSVRDKNKYTHWHDFIGAFNEIGADCYYSQILNVRKKQKTGKPLDKLEREFYMHNKKDIIMTCDMTQEDIEFMNEDW